MRDPKLTEQERQLLGSVESDEWQTVAEAGAELDRYRSGARATFRKDKRLNLRISERDLIKLHERALEEGLPYQTLVSSVLHKYLAGRMVERPVRGPDAPD